MKCSFMDFYVETSNKKPGTLAGFKSQYGTEISAVLNADESRG
ncbi:hypothetical protein BADSM9389_25470 [Buttiauxella agrestis]|nr:hypothetical protein BADSM9389_25470 [Buttiauxella agrestis]